MEPIEMYLDEDMNFGVGDEEFLFFVANKENDHGGKEVIIKKSRWEAMGSPNPIYINLSSSVVTVEKIAGGVMTLNEIRGRA